MANSCDPSAKQFIFIIRDLFEYTIDQNEQSNFKLHFNKVLMLSHVQRSQYLTNPLPISIKYTQNTYLQFYHIRSAKNFHFIHNECGEFCDISALCYFAHILIQNIQKTSFSLQKPIFKKPDGSELYTYITQMDTTVRQMWL